MGKLGWTEHEYYTCSPYMFFAACEGYLAKERQQSALVRIQTLILAQSTGAKRKGGGDLKATDLWLLEGEDKQASNTFVWPENVQEFKEKMQKAHGIKLG